MARRGIKKKDYERLDDATVSRVVSLLEQEKPITKKAACEILNISYNTTRLNKIIESYKDKLEYDKKRRAAVKGKPFSDLEIQELVVDYLNGDSITGIANHLYRSIHTVKKKIEELHLPERTKNSSYFQPDLLPDEAVSEIFEKGELVWSSRYNAVAEIRADKCLGKTGLFRIWVFGKHNEFAYQPWWELGKLDIVKQYNISADRFVNTEKPNFHYRID